MLNTLGKTQQNLLKALLANRSGLTIEDLISCLEITRTAIRQHLNALEALGYLEKGKSLSTGGRPRQYYVLTDAGYNLFPKQYSLFSEILLGAIIKEKGHAEAEKWLNRLGKDVAASFKGTVKGRTIKDRIAETVSVMNTLAYEAEAVEDEASNLTIEAKNCVYHSLAAEYPVVCTFDLALLSGLTEAQVVHEKCIQAGDNVCRFCFKSGMKKPH